jgi:hypothetical protein
VSEYLRLGDGTLAVLTDGLVIGRQPTCAICLQSTSVSREHAVVRGAPGRWYLEDKGSRNGTRVNATVLTFGQPHPLRHDDLVRVGDVEMLVVSTAELQDPDRTDSLDAERAYRALGLSPFQHQVVRCLAEPWLVGEEPASNAEIADRLGTPSAVDAVKAALRRIYAKVGLTDDTSRGKRRELCRIARRNGWL